MEHKSDCCNADIEILKNKERKAIRCLKCNRIYGIFVKSKKSTEILTIWIPLGREDNI